MPFLTRSGQSGRVKKKKKEQKTFIFLFSVTALSVWSWSLYLVMRSSHCSRALRRLRGRTNPYVYVVFRCVGIAALISSWRLWWIFDDDFGFLHGTCHPEVSTNLYTSSPFSGCWCGALHWCSITIITNPNNLKPDRSIYCRDVTRDSAVFALFQRVNIFHIWL